MPRARKLTDEIQLLIAQMHGERQMNNHAIARALDLSESAVSKVIKESFRQSRLVLTFNRHGLTREQLAFLDERSDRESRLVSRIAKYRKDGAAVITEPAIRIFDSGSTETSQEAWAARLAAFGAKAGHHLVNLICRSACVGTSWGGTLAALIR